MYVLQHKPMIKHLIAAGALATIAAGSVIAVTGAETRTATRADVNAYVNVEQPHEGTWASMGVTVDTPAGPLVITNQVTQSGGPTLTCYLLGVDPIEQC